MSVDELLPNILAETDTYLVIDKPVGMLVHTDGRSTTPTVVEWLLQYYPAITSVGDMLATDDESEYTPDQVLRPGIVHRLDRDTSGVLIIAKTQEMFWHLKRQFKNREIEKEYRAIVCGIPKQEKSRIAFPIGKHISQIGKWAVGNRARGELREAITYCEVLHSYSRLDRSYSSVRLVPKTGRTHQLRVHLSAIGNPILGDSVYGSVESTEYSGKLGITRQLLHAYTLSFTDLSDDRITVSADIPDDITLWI